MLTELPSWPRKLPSARLGLFQLPDQQLVPFLPGRHIALKECLGLIVAGVLRPRLLRGLVDALLEVVERGLELLQVLAASDREDKRRDRAAGQ